jgi:peptide/nickel transport system substrate-binding protein
MLSDQREIRVSLGDIMPITGGWISGWQNREREMARRFFRIVLALAAASFFVTAAWAEELRIGVKTEPSSMDPHFHNLGPNNAFMTNVFGRLIDMDYQQHLKPDLAVSWKPINDTTWEIKLRKGVKFSDGSPFTADDVIFSFERAVNYVGGNSSFRTYLSGKTFKKIDDYTIQAITKEPYPLMPVDLAQPNIVSSKVKGTGKPDVNKGLTVQDFNDGKAMVGTGPYKFVEWKKGDRIVLEANPYYFGEKAKWSKVIIKPIASAPARVAALLAGDVDMIDNVPTSDVERLKKNKKFVLSSGISNRVIYLHMDQFRDQSPFVTDKDGNPLKKNPLKDVRVRKALSKLINRDAIVSRVMEGIAIPAGQLLPKGFFGVSPKLKPEKYDPKGAKKLLKEAGYPNGFGLTIHGPNDRYVNDAKICEVVAQMFTHGGIPTKVVTMPKSVFFSRASSGGPNKEPEFSLILVGWGSGTGEASSALKSLIMTHDKSKGFGASNRGRFSDPKVDKLVEDALATVDDPKREKLLQEATELAIGKDQAIIPLHYQVNTWATKKGLKYRARTDERTIVMDVLKTKK